MPGSYMAAKIQSSGSLSIEAYAGPGTVQFDQATVCNFMIGDEEE